MPSLDEYHLAYLQWNDVLLDLNDYLQNNDLVPFSENYLSRFHTVCFPKVKPSASTRQNKCGICSQFKKARKNATNDQDCLKFQKKLRVHNNQQMPEEVLVTFERLCAIQD